MKDKVMINGVEYVPKVIAPEPVKVGRWKPKYGEVYLWVDLDGVSRHAVNENLFFDDRMLKMGNYYQTEALATKACDKQLLLVELQDFADRANVEQEGEHGKNRFVIAMFDDEVCWISSGNEISGQAKFNTEYGANSAIMHFGDRLNLLK